MVFKVFISFFIILSSLHYYSGRHWVFRNIEFAKIQLCIFQFIILVLCVLTRSRLDVVDYVLLILLSIVFLHNVIVLVPFTFLYSFKKHKLSNSHKNISFLSVNVFQNNDEYDKLIEMINRLKPDILLTMESNKAWEKALENIEYLYESKTKIPKDNTYGIHFYTKLKVEKVKVNYLVASDIPSIEADLSSHENIKLKFYGIHPPPPSPTEEVTSKERDAELLLLAKKINETKKPCIVIGDFNNVSWSRSSKLFKKTSQLLDPRIGRGFLSTFHAKYWFFRFPLDLVFHSPSIYVEILRREKNINSDHFPLYGEFIVKDSYSIEGKEHLSNKATQSEKVEIYKVIKEGIATKSENRS